MVFGHLVLKHKLRRFKTGDWRELTWPEPGPNGRQLHQMRSAQFSAALVSTALNPTLTPAFELEAPATYVAPAGHASSKRGTVATLLGFWRIPLAIAFLAALFVTVASLSTSRSVPTQTESTATSLTSGALELALLRPEDLQSGWSVAQGPTQGELPPPPSLESLCGINVPSTTATGRIFTTPSEIAFLKLEVVPAGTGVRSFGEASTTVNSCSSFDRFTISPQTLPAIGEQSVALRVEMTDQPGAMDFVLFRRGDVLANVALFSTENLNGATAQDIAQKADAKLLRVLQDASPR